VNYPSGFFKSRAAKVTRRVTHAFQQNLQLTCLLIWTSSILAKIKLKPTIKCYKIPRTHYSSCVRVRTCHMCVKEQVWHLCYVNEDRLGSIIKFTTHGHHSQKKAWVWLLLGGIDLIKFTVHRRPSQDMTSHRHGLGGNCNHNITRQHHTHEWISANIP